MRHGKHLHCQHLQAMLLIGLLSFSACSRDEIYSVQGTALGTVYEILYTSPAEDAGLPSRIDSLLKAYDNCFSIFNAQSLLSRINRNETDSLSEELETLINRAVEISRITDGAFDITAGPLIEAWGFGTACPMEPDERLKDSLKQITGYDKIRIKDHRLIKENNHIQLNVNAIAKGFIVDRLAGFLRREHPSFLINIGGEIVCEGRRPGRLPWNIGIQIPTSDSTESGDYFHRFRLREGLAVATSGDYRRYRTDAEGKRFSHIIDPRTACPEHTDILSATLIAEDCMTADALATACMVLGKDASIRLMERKPEWAACLIGNEKGKWEIYYTKNFPK